MNKTKTRVTTVCEACYEVGVLPADKIGTEVECHACACRYVAHGTVFIKEHCKTRVPIDGERPATWDDHGSYWQGWAILTAAAAYVAACIAGISWLASLFY